MVAPEEKLMDSFEIGDLRITTSSVKSLHPLTDIYLRSFELYKNHIDLCLDERDIKIYNMALLVNCVAYVESLVNQNIELNIKSYSEAEIKKYKRCSKISEKWNLIKTHANSENLWNKGDAIFSDFDALLSLRNEVLHYKCDFLDSAEVPSKNIKRIMCEICDESPFGNKPFHTLMFESWCEHLLKHKKLASWVIRVTKKLTEKYNGCA